MPSPSGRYIPPRTAHITPCLPISLPHLEPVPAGQARSCPRGPPLAAATAARTAAGRTPEPDRPGPPLAHIAAQLVPGTAHVCIAGTSPGIWTPSTPPPPLCLSSRPLPDDVRDVLHPSTASGPSRTPAPPSFLTPAPHGAQLIPSQGAAAGAAGAEPVCRSAGTMSLDRHVQPQAGVGVLAGHLPQVKTSC